jgi:hypothetical protein
MPKPYKDQFILQLRQLRQFFPDYKHILDPLIDIIEQGKEARVKEKLDQLKKEDW